MSAVDYPALVADLGDEEDALDRIVDGLDAARWATMTAAEGWDVGTTVEHLAGAEALATVALTEPAEFAHRFAALLEEGHTPRPADAVLARWQRERADVLDALSAAGPRDRFPWIAGDMSAVSFATARLMETWAHGWDIAAALGLPYPASARLRHVAELGVRTRPFAFAAHGVPLPEGEVRVEVTGPDGEAWTWGDSATDVVRGTALDFCLVVTQRRHVDDSALVVEGAFSRQWMAIAQAFAGPPTTARRVRPA